MMKLRGLAIVGVIETQSLASPSLSLTITLSSVNPSFTTVCYIKLSQVWVLGYCVSVRVHTSVSVFVQYLVLKVRDLREICYLAQWPNPCLIVCACFD